MMNRSASGYSRAQTGFTLIEVLVAIVIISVGLLGVAAMQYAGLQDSNRSNERSVATILAYDIADRMRANPQGAINGDYNNAAPQTPPNCSGTGVQCSTAQLAQADLADWYELLDATLASGTASITCADAVPAPADALPCSPGSIHTIQVMWDERRSGADQTNCNNNAPDSELFCLSVDVQI